MSLHEKNKVDYDLLAKYFAGETSARESAAVRSWADESTENQMQFAEMKFMWADTQAMKNIDQLELPDVDVESALNKVKSKPSAQPKPHMKVVKSSNFNFFLRIAAGLALLVGAGWFVMNNLNQQPANIELAATEEVIDQTLSDGSSIKLNQGAKITYPEKFAANTRTVELEGEAFFDVKPDAEKPFIVEAGEATIKVLGTSFNIKSHEGVDSTLVHVESGKVLLYFGDSQVMLTKGMTGVFYKKTKKVAILDKNSPDHSFWRNRNLSFKRTDLTAAVSKLNNLYNANIRLEINDLSNCTLTVDFENKTINEILDIISLTLDLEVLRSDGQIILRGEGC